VSQPYQRTPQSAPAPTPAPAQAPTPEENTAEPAPVLGDASAGGQTAAAGTSQAGDEYDNEDVWGYRDLQQEVKGRGMNAQGTRDELVHRLRDDDAARSISANAATSTDTPSSTTADTGTATGAAAESTTDEGGTMTAASNDQDRSDKNLGAETTTPEPPSAEQTPQGDPGDQYPEHGSIGLTDTGGGRNQAEVLQGLSNERREAQLEALKEQNLNTGGQPTKQG
jgi:hypothetical protein